VHCQLQELLQEYRKQRAFRPDAYLKARLQLLNDYLRRSRIKGCVVGVSGGIDSALVLALMVRASRQSGSPLRLVIPALMPMFVEAGASNQDQALARGREVAAWLGVQEALVDLSRPLNSMKIAVDQGYGRVGQPWAAGQLVSYLRTPALYYLTALLTEDELLAVLCGTTNRDEGAYIGFFGKASDGMVDLQPISDLHKWEVRQLALHLGMPESVMQATPTGDTYDGRHDELMIGAPYDFLELYQHWLCADQPALDLCPEARAQWQGWAHNLEDLHQKNLHKYLVGSVAVHLDILERPVPGGWRSEVYLPWQSGPSPEGKLVGEFSLKARPGRPPNPLCKPDGTEVDSATAKLDSAWKPDSPPDPPVCLGDFGEAAFYLDGILSPDECAELMAEVLDQPQVAVGIHGRTQDADRTGGSTRATAYSRLWAEELWKRLAPRFPQVKTFDELSSTDHGGHPVWRAVGVNPVLRFICYHQGGQLVPHYDAGFDFQDGRRYTLMSLVVYLNSLPEGLGGRTRFLLDPQRGLPVAERNHDDWEQPAGPERVLLGVQPLAGRALIFDHRLLHDGEAWNGDQPRLLLRTDIIFERCGLLPGTAHKRPAAESVPQVPERIQADPFYGQLYPLLGPSGVEEAGYFEDSRPSLRPDPRQDSEWLCTPLFKARENLKRAPDSAPLAVLLTTGALCPVHPGHLAMLEQAREHLENQGIAVLAGYLSPGHDEYVLGKCGHRVPRAAHRVHLCRQAVAESNWLMVDEWEALHTSAALNFTEVIERLTGYLNRHLACGRPIRVYYVFGSDNARFALTFIQRGQAICIQRPGFEDRLSRYSQHPFLIDNPRVSFLADVRVPDLASTQVRAGDVQVLDPPVRSLWQDWQVADPASRPARLFLRDEGEWSMQHWLDKVSGEALQARGARFAQGVKEAIEQGFDKARLPDPPSPLQLSILSLQEQRTRARERVGDTSLLSLDPCLPGHHNLGVSRCFELCANEVRPGLVARPGWPALDEQFASIPAGEYWLVDDDIATGRTMEQVMARLPEHCRVLHREALCQLPHFEEPGQLVDLGDLRDFLLGSWEGGLVVKLPPGGLARVPYLMPYVNPADRLSLPISQAYTFSRRVWQLNHEFFQDLPISLADTPEAFRSLTRYLGIPDHWTLADWCLWHLNRMPEVTE